MHKRRYGPRTAAMLLAGMTMAHGAAAMAACQMGRVARLPVTMENRRAMVPVTVNGTPTTFGLDSGSFINFMSQARAAELALPLRALPTNFSIIGIGGAFTPQQAVIKSFVIAGTEIRNVGFAVGGSDAGIGMIGLNLLAVFDTDYDLANGRVDLFSPKGCERSNMAYWAKGQSVSVVDWLPGEFNGDNHLYVMTSVNGKPVRALLDTGAPTSLIPRIAAERAGIDLSAPGVVALEPSGGLGSRSRKSWVVRLASFGIGGEEIHNTTIRVIDEPNTDMNQMLLGVDFFLAHHVLASHSQRLIYFSYNGGPVFSLAAAGDAGQRPSFVQQAPATTPGTDAPADAAGLARRGAARMARADYAGAITDLSQAIGQDPKVAAYYHDRAKAHYVTGDTRAASADFDKAIALAPTDRQYLIERSFNRIAEHDTTGALADAEAAAALMPAGGLDNLALITLFERLHQPARNLALLDPMIRLHGADRLLGQLLNARCWAHGLANSGLDEGMADCNAAIRRDGPLPAYRDSRALIFLRQQNYTAAIADYDAVLAAKPDMAASLYLRGWAKRAQGQTEAGATDMAAATKIQPDIAEQFQPYGFGA